MELIKIQSIQKKRYKGEVYDLCVKDVHTYNIEGLKVHNSGAGMLVNFCLGITDVDPIKFGLIAERFMNPERKDMADIDVDFSPDIRHGVKKNIKVEFGEEFTADISVWGTLGVRSGLSDTSRVYGIDYSEVKRVTAEIESDADEFSIQQLRDTYPKFSDFYNKYGERNSPDYKKGLFYCFDKLRGQIKNLGTHAAGVVVTKNPIMYDIALSRIEDKDTKEITYVSMWVEGATRSELGRIGRPKFDVLGLKTLKELKEINDFIEARHGKRINIAELPLDDEEAYKLCRSGENDGVFQLHSSTMCRLCSDSEVKDVFGVSAISAVGRPATLRAGVADEYCLRASGKKHFKLNERLVDVLGETFGVIVYQEQTMYLPVVMANFTMAEADKMRKFLSKIKDDKVQEYEEKIQELKNKFIKNSVKNGYDEKFVLDTWDQIWEFRTYGFNKSHAIAYGLITNSDLYFKAHYKVEFWAGKLNNTKPTFDSSKGEESKTEKFSGIANKIYGITIKPPRINSSKPMFDIEDDTTITYGLWFIKGVKNNSLKLDLDTEYKTISQFMEKNPKANKSCMRGLINVGFFDPIYANRKRLITAFEAWSDSDGNNKKGTLGEMLAQHTNIDNFNKIELMERERQYLGFYLSDHPTSELSEVYDQFNIKTVEEMLEDVSGFVMGILNKVKVIVARNGKEMAFVTLEDYTGELEITIFNDEFNLYKEKIKSGNMLAINVKRNDRGFNVTNAFERKGRTQSKKKGRAMIVDLDELLKKVK